MIGNSSRYIRNVRMSAASAPKATKNTLLMMLEMRNGIMVRISKVATKKIEPIRAHMLASVIWPSMISKRRSKIAS